MIQYSSQVYFDRMGNVISWLLQGSEKKKEKVLVGRSWWWKLEPSHIEAGVDAKHSLSGHEWSHCSDPLLSDEWMSVKKPLEMRNVWSLWYQDTAIVILILFKCHYSTFEASSTFVVDKWLIVCKDQSLCTVRLCLVHEVFELVLVCLMTIRSRVLRTAAHRVCVISSV